MSLTTCAVRARVYKQNGEPDEGALVVATLNRFDVDGGYIGPNVVEATVDADGVAILNLWPNARGATESTYTVRINGSERTLTTTASVPDVANIDLETIAALPPYPGKPEGAVAIEAAAEYAAVATSRATEAAASAGAANSSAVSAAASEQVALRTLPTSSSAPPSDPLPNTEWIDTDTGRKYTWLVQNGVGVWAEIGALLVIATPDVASGGGGGGAVAPADIGALAVTARLAELNTEQARAEARQNLGLQVIDGGTFN